MVESIGARLISSETKVTRIAPARPVASVVASAVPTGDTTALGGVARVLAAKPPVDVDRVALVRRAIERGEFPILPATIAALKANDVHALERATSDKLRCIDEVAAAGTGPAGDDMRELADEANRLNETCRIYVNLMAANVRRRLQTLTGDAGAGYKPTMARAYA